MHVRVQCCVDDNQRFQRDSTGLTLHPIAREGERNGIDT